MPKAERTPIAKTARATPYPYPNTGPADVTNFELTEGAATVEEDSGYHSSTENSYPDGPDEQAYLTHPRCYGNDHVEKLETFANDLDQALKSSFPPTPTADTYPYAGVFVLLLRWMDDDLQVHREITKLHNVFAAQFSFQVEQWQIPSITPTRALQTKLYDFQNSHQSEKELLIVYYGGHGEADPRRGRSLWRANDRPNSPSLNWSSLQHLLETAVPYVLIILDCCFAANAARDTAEGSTKEILAACGRESPTLGVCDRSFTAVLVEEMQAFGKTPFTVAMLHSRLVTMRWRLAFTPVYALLSEHGGSSIAISPMPQSSPPLAAELDSLDTLSADLPANGAVELEGPGSIADSSLSSQTSRSNNLETRVLLSVSVAQEAELDLAHWATWLATAAPWNVMKVDVRIESVFKSHSTLVLVSIPTTGWNLLAERPAYKFIGFIRSQNLVQTTVDSRAKCIAKSTPSDELRSSCEDQEALERPFSNQFRSTTPHTNSTTIDADQRPQTRLASCVPRTRQSVILHDVKSKSWPPESDELLIRARQQGLNWVPIATQYFPSKTANTCRKRHERLMEKRNNIDDWDNSNMLALADAYHNVRKQMWRAVADQVSEKWQIVEAKCMKWGLETLQVASKRQQFGSTSDDRVETSDTLYGHSRRNRSNSPRDNSFADSALGPEEDSAPGSDTEREQSYAASTRNEQSLQSKRAKSNSGTSQSMNVGDAIAESLPMLFGELSRDAPRYSLEGKENATPPESAQGPALEQSRKHPPWSTAEEQRLKTMREAGDTWGDIAKSFPERTEGSLKKHWYKDMHNADFAEEDSAALAVAIKDYKASMWKVVGQKVGKPAKACQQYAKEHLGGE